MVGSKLAVKEVISHGLVVRHKTQETQLKSGEEL